MTTPHQLVISPQSGRGFPVKAGQHIRIIDPDGQQVTDMWAIVSDGGNVDWLSTSQTRDITERLFPQPGESFYSEQAIPLLTLIEDNSPCPHDMLFPACNTGLYERAGFPNHPNCRDNFLNAIRQAGMSVPICPDPVNLFQRSEPQQDGRLEVLASNNPPGGNVVLRAEVDLLMVLTACSVDYHPTNGGKCTAISVEIS
ncbi:urea carboxylase-associated family protein [Falsochrobactrum sp. TDYN1]|nr:urea carboxylase-associated family protein [Falsochrobactrum sp. TDYN1]MBV2145066.1 urea carboxylase-associated family protein [Falsochrobactrum sp. TDYN1]